MDDFKISCAHSERYPRNLLNASVPTYTRQAIEDQLNQRSKQLFCDETATSGKNRPSLNFLEGSTQGLKPSNLSTLQALQTHLAAHAEDSKLRYISIEAPHSCERLKLSRSMFNYLMTYHQVTPFFVEFVLPFGRRDYKQDFPHCGFRNVSRLHEADAGTSIPQYSLSGRQIEISYSLLSVEPSTDLNDPTRRQWSIRMCSIYHAFDVETGKTTWMTVKGNTVIRKLLETQLAECAEGRTASSEVHRRFKDTLKVHLILVQWAAEYWHSYISHIQDDLQERTRHANSISVQSSTSTESLKQRMRTLDYLYSANVDKQRPQFMVPFRRLLRRLGSTKSKEGAVVSGGIEMTTEPEPMDDDSERFSFDDVQDVQALGDRATEVMVALRTNRNVVDSLARGYLSMASLLKPEWRGDIEDFARKLQDIMSHFDMQKSNADTLLSFINERKTQLYAILQFENMESTRDLAVKAHVATCAMQLMTLDMQVVTRKMKSEAISMRVITLVTLFFLPGTFISTLMSTPIVSFEPDSKGFSTQNIGQGALQFYVTISLPLMCLTFFVWYAVHWRESRQAARHARAIAELKFGDDLV